MSNEVVTEDIVLDKEDLREADSRVFLYTKELGKISAKATSARKITSKLSAHIEPLNYITVRLIAKRDALLDGRGFQLGDALLISKNKLLNLYKLRNALQSLRFIARAIPTGVVDEDMWNFLHQIISGEISPSTDEVLSFIGFGNDFSNCEICNVSRPEYFYTKNSVYVCSSCMLLSKPLKEEFFKI